MSDFSLYIDLHGNTRFPEASSVQCTLEWDGDPAELRTMAAEFYGVPLKQVAWPQSIPEPCDVDMPLVGLGETIGVCSKCGAAREADYTCRAGGTTTRAESGASDG